MYVFTGVNAAAKPPRSTCIISPSSELLRQEKIIGRLETGSFSSFHPSSSILRLDCILHGAKVWPRQLVSTLSPLPAPWTDKRKRPEAGRRLINNPFPGQPAGLGFVTGDLVFNDTVTSQAHAAGEGFEVRWQAEDGGSLQVYHRSEPKRAVWSTVAGKSFVSAAMGKESFEETRGSVAVHDSVETVCSHQSVEQIFSLGWPADMMPSLERPSYESDSQVANSVDGAAEFFPRVDADGTAVGNRGPCVIIAGCLYPTAALAGQHMPVEVTPSALTQHSGRGRTRRISNVRQRWMGPHPVTQDKRLKVPYRLIFYESREHQLGFSVSLDPPEVLESRSRPAIRTSATAVVVPTVDAVAHDDTDIEEARMNDHEDCSDAVCHCCSRNGPSSDGPASAFHSRSAARAARSAGFGSGRFRRRSWTPGAQDADSSFRTRGLRWESSPTPNVFPSGLKLNSPAAFLLHLMPEAGHHWRHGRLRLPRFNRVMLTYSTSEGERFFGFGEQFSHFDLKGKRVPILVQEQGIGRGDQPVTALANFLSSRAGGDWHTTYAPIPYYMTSEMRSLYLEGYEYAVFDLRRPEAVQLQVHAGSMHGRILHGKTPAEIIERYTAATGRMRELPGWILKGAVVGLQGGPDAVRRVWHALRDLDVPLSAFWLQDWVGQRKTSIGWQLWWNWEVDRSHYPGWEQLVQELRQHGIRTMAYCNPLLAPTDDKPNRRRDLLEEAHRQGFVVGDGTGAPYMVPNTSFDAAMVDLTNVAARTWLKGILHDMVQTGIRGWMADFGEALPLDSSLFSGEDPRAVHNRYPELWAEVNREFVEEWEAAQRRDRKRSSPEAEKVLGASPESEGNGAEKEDDDDEDEKLVFFTRAGYRASPRWSTLFWEGDQMVSWQRNDGIKSAVTGLLSGGLCGYSLNHSDIGGYCTVDVGLPLLRYRRSDELLLRWTELNAFSTVFRTHEGNVPEANSQIYSNKTTLHHFARFARIYRAWHFYRKQLVKEAARVGLPVVRHLFIHYPHDEVVQGLVFEQFLVGDQFLVVPVLDQGKRRVKAYFPRGVDAPEAWEHLWTGKVYTSDPDRGLTAEIDAPLGFPAVFIRCGSAVGLTFRRNLVAEGVLPSP